MFKMQILVNTPDGKEWRDVHPTNAPAYKFETEEKARNMLEMCYPDAIREEVRIIEV